MLKERQAAIANVAAVFRPAELAARDAACGGAKTISTMLEEATKNNLAPDLGTDVLETIAEATLRAVQTYQLFAKAHRELKELPAKIGVRSYGADECPPDEPFYKPSGERTLRVVGGGE